MRPIHLIAPLDKLNQPKLQKLIAYIENLQIPVLLSTTPQITNFSLFKAQYYPAFKSPQNILYNRNLTYQAMSPLQKFLPIFPSTFQLWKSITAAGTKTSHDMQVQSTKNANFHCQSLVLGVKIAKIYCVYEQVVKSLFYDYLYLPKAFNSQTDKTEIFGEKTTGNDAEIAQIQDLALKIYKIFNLDLISFDCVFDCFGKVFVVDVNYFTHDSIECEEWFEKWYDRKGRLVSE